MSVWFQDGKFLKKYILLSLIVYYQRKLKTIIAMVIGRDNSKLQKYSN